ncbi:MAG: 50S ribosomal protein L20 [Candidatus Buchananbacteria bacterium]|nr:50S ribosomal protein L20 [Candidatus Buchananbacteria bacterium]
MPRVKRGVIHTKNRRNILKKAKGYRWGRKNRIKLAKTAIMKAGAYAFRDRRTKKRVIRRTWQVKLNAAVREHDMSYSQFIAGLVKANISLDRKVLAELAEKQPAVFAKIVEKVKA